MDERYAKRKEELLAECQGSRPFCEADIPSAGRIG